MIFENLQNKPINQLYLQIKEDFVLLQVPALSEKWVESRCHTKYFALPINVNGKLNSESYLLDNWITETQFFNKEIEGLLRLEHFKFWSCMVYDAGCIESIISFLQESTPCYIPIAKLTDNIKIIDLYSSVLRNVLTVICRLITNKESDSEWMPKEYLAELLYTKYIISIPMIFDLVTTYGRDNSSILSRIIQTIFMIEPKYENDLKSGLLYIKKVFDIVHETTQTDQTIKTWNDLSLHTLDSAVTLSIFLEIYPAARELCATIKIPQSITQFYEHTIPLLYKNIFNIDPHASSLGYINHARIELLSCFRTIINMHMEKILKYPKKSLLSAEMFLNVLTECVAERVFIIDYQKLYPMQIDLDIIKQACPKIDNFKVDFISQAFLIENSHIDEIEENINEHYNYFTENDGAVGLSELTTISSVIVARDIDKEVKTVLDVLPEYGDGFIRKLLLRYENAELAITACLEGNLPPDLDSADKQAPHIPLDLQDKMFLETGIQRLNIFDGDDYDVMTHDNPKGIIKRGKGLPGQPKNLKALLDDKSHVRELRSRYQEYSMVPEDNYDDEYDDSYDAVAESESKTVRSKAVKNIIMDEIDDNESSQSSEDEHQDSKPSQRSKDFCENPEVIRARYEQNRQSKMLARGGGSKWKGGITKNFDVVGKPKGQGQDEKTIANRTSKEVNKSSRANHNRKQGSSWKQNRGMIPSSF